MIIHAETDIDMGNKEEISKRARAVNITTISYDIHAIHTHTPSHQAPIWLFREQKQMIYNFDNMCISETVLLVT